MNITDNLIRIKEGKDNIIKSLKNKGVDIADNTLINEIPTIIDNAEIGGGGGDTPSQPETPELVQKYEGASVFRINVPTDNYEFAINLCNNASTATYDVDWGDGSLESGLTTDEQHHTYSKAGTYDVNVYNISKDITLGGRVVVNKEGDMSYTLNIPYLFNKMNDMYFTFDNYIYNNLLVQTLLGDNIISLGSYCFAHTSTLKKITFNNLITYIPEYCFYQCYGLSDVILSNSITSISSYVFSDCFSLYYLEIPDSVQTLSNNCFKNCYSLKKITIPNSINKIPDNCFDSCLSLNDIEIPNTVTVLGDSCFTNTNIQKINLPEYCTEMDYSLTYCKSLQTVVIPNGITNITGGGVSGCKLLQEITFPSTVNKLSGQTFADCGLLYSITFLSTNAPTLSSNVFSSNSFKNVSGSKYIYIPDDADIETYKTDKWKQFFLDKGWEIKLLSEKQTEKVPCEIKYTASGKLIGKYKYIGNAELINEISDGNEYIYQYDNEINYIPNLFFSKTNVVKVTLPSTLKGFTQKQFYNCSSLEEITIPQTQKSILSYTFYNCTKLNNIVLPEILESIDYSAFYGCSSLTLIEIPKNVTSIQNQAFYYCSKLSTITCKAMVAPIIQSNTFNSVGSSVPSGTPKVLRIPESASGYEETTSEWYKQLIAKGYKVEYIPLSEL